MAERPVAGEVGFGLRWGLIIGGSTSALLILLYAAASRAGISIDSLNRDSAATAGLDWHVGAVSHAGILVLTAGAVAALFTVSLLPHSGRRSLRGYLFSMGVLTLVMALDDLYMLHDTVFPWQLGIAEQYVFAAYVLGAISIMGYFRAVVARTHFSLLVLAGGSIAISVLIDQLRETVALPPLASIAEDAAKFIAWMLLAVYLVWTSRDAMLAREPRRQDDDGVVSAPDAIDAIEDPVIVREPR